MVSRVKPIKAYHLKQLPGKLSKVDAKKTAGQHDVMSCVAGVGGDSGGEGVWGDANILATEGARYQGL